MFNQLTPAEWREAGKRFVQAIIVVVVFWALLVAVKGLG